MFDPTTCHVERSEHDDYLLSWDGPAAGREIAIYMAEAAEPLYHAASRGAPLLRTRETRLRISNPDPSLRHYFCLESPCGESLVLAERKLTLAGSPNFRDLGGYQAGCGRRLRWGRLYRSGKLSGLTDSDAAYVKRLGVTLICDFRQVLEQELEPTVLGEDHPHLLASLPVLPGSSQSFLDNLHNGILAVDDASAFMHDINRDFVASQLPRYAEMFQLLLAGDQSLLIHCASGKDRTGFGAALILDVLGVGEEAIVEDYLLSNRYLPIDTEIERLAGQLRDRGGRPVSADRLRPMMEVRPEYIRACFEEIRRRYANREHFYEQALQLGPEAVARLRERYLH